MYYYIISINFLWFHILSEYGKCNFCKFHMYIKAYYIWTLAVSIMCFLTLNDLFVTGYKKRYVELFVYLFLPSHWTVVTSGYLYDLQWTYPLGLCAPYYNYLWLHLEFMFVQNARLYYLSQSVINWLHIFLHHAYNSTNIFITISIMMLCIIHSLLPCNV